jgi:hypothetical protein
MVARQQGLGYFDGSVVLIAAHGGRPGAGGGRGRGAPGARTARRPPLGSNQRHRSYNPPPHMAVDPARAPPRAFPSDDAQGSIGFILNRPSSLRLADVAGSAAAGAVAGVADVLGGQRLGVGGPVHRDTLTVLHGYSGCQGAQKVVEVRRPPAAAAVLAWLQPRAPA